MQMAHAAVCHVCAWRVGDHNIPIATIGDFQRVALYMPARVTISRQQVARPRIKPTGTERISDSGAVFTGNQNAFHRLYPFKL
jgi:hypothetical protein